MPSENIVRLRRALADRGLTPATWIAEAAEGRADEAHVRPARLVEDDRLRSHAVGPREPCPEPMAFLDGIQRFEITGYLASAPLVVATVAAAVRERSAPGARPRMVVRAERRLAIARRDVLDACGDVLGEMHRIPLAEDVAGHPVREVQAARREVERARAALEREVGARFRDESEAWLLIDGALSEGIDWVADPRMIGVVKSHSTLPFAGEDQAAYLQLPDGHRTSVFAPETRSLAPVYSWALRLWPWENEDLFHGLIRVETRAADDAIERADLVSRWLLAERAPLSTPDSRWDRLLYGIHDVEVYLRSRTVHR